MTTAAFTARVIASHGRHYVARDTNGKLWHCIARGKKRDVAVNDLVHVTDLGNSGDVSQPQAVIEEIDVRKNLFKRSDQFKEKAIAANVDQVWFVVATEPSFDPELLSRCQVYVLKSLEKNDLLELLNHAINDDTVLKEREVQLKETDALLRYSGGDARKLLNILDLITAATPEGPIVIDNGTVTARRGRCPPRCIVHDGAQRRSGSVQAPFPGLSAGGDVTTSGRVA